MFHSRNVEIWVGIFVAGGLAALFMLAMQVSNLSVVSAEEGYDIRARFENTSGLKVRSPVTVAGVRIGRVSGIVFDENTFEAVVTMRINSEFDTLPLDTSASILTAGLLGEKYVGLEPGGDVDTLTDGDELMITQSSLVLENLIGKFMLNSSDKKDEKDE